MSILNEELQNITKYFINKYPRIKFIKNNNIKIIEIIYDYNEKIENIPSEITGIYFHNFNQEVDNIPHTIIKLYFDSSFTRLLNNLPISIVELNMDFCCGKMLTNLPNSIKKMTIYITSTSYINFPNSLNELTMIIDDKNYYELKNVVLKNLPVSIKKLTLSINWYYLNKNSFNIMTNINKILYSLPQTINNLKMNKNTRALYIKKFKKFVVYT